MGMVYDTEQQVGGRFKLRTCIGHALVYWIYPFVKPISCAFYVAPSSMSGVRKIVDATPKLSYLAVEDHL